MTPPSGDPDDQATDDGPVSPEDVYETMTPLEPYTTREVANVLEVPKQLARRLLEALTGKGQIRKKELEPNRAIWIRKPPTYTCPNCGYRFELRFIHPVLSSVKFCPQCGTQLR